MGEHYGRNYKRVLIVLFKTKWRCTADNERTRMHLMSTSMPALDDTETQQCELSVLMIHTTHINIYATQMSSV